MKPRRWNELTHPRPKTKTKQCACGHFHLLSVGDKSDAGCVMLGRGCDCWDWRAS